MAWAVAGQLISFWAHSKDWKSLAEPMTLHPVLAVVQAQLSPSLRHDRSAPAWNTLPTPPEAGQASPLPAQVNVAAVVPQTFPAKPVVVQQVSPVVAQTNVAPLDG
jgi:hypothetical protein